MTFEEFGKIEKALGQDMVVNIISDGVFKYNYIGSYTKDEIKIIYNIIGITKKCLEVRGFNRYKRACFIEVFNFGDNTPLFSDIQREYRKHKIDRILEN